MSRAPSFQSLAPAAILLAFLGSLFLAIPAMAQRPLTLARYDQALAAVRDRARQAGGGSSISASAAMAAITPLLRCAVNTGGQGLVFADNRPILAQMQGAQLEAGASARRRQWSEIALEIASIRSSAPTLDPAKAQSAVASATAVLSTAEFRSEPLPSLTAWDRFWDRVGAWIQRQLDKIHWPRFDIAPDSVNRQIPEIILIVILIFVVGLTVSALIQWWRNRSAGSVAGAGGDSSLAMTLEERELVATHNFARLRELAQQAAARGDYRSGFRLVFLALLVFLDAEGAIKLDRSKTNWEYLRLLGGLSDVRERLTPLVRDFDRIWYGELAATEEDFGRADAQFLGVRELILSRMPLSPTSPASKNSTQKAARTT